MYIPYYPFKLFMSSSYLFEDRSELDTAVDAWISNEYSATTTYGDINTWDVSAITDFSGLFSNRTTFNSDISSWDVSSGTNFGGMFYQANSFNSFSLSENLYVFKRKSKSL